MHLKIDSGEKGQHTATVQPLVRYLEKEDRACEQPALFFDQTRSAVPSEEVIKGIDGNTKKLGRKDAKYFMLTISPSEKELRHIGNDADKLRSFSRVVMEHYAAGFQRGIQGQDLVYFGKIEYGRAFTSKDPAVRQGYVPAGTPKPGLQTHVHLIVSRKDKTGRLKLSPKTNHKKNKGNFQGGFHRVKFFLSAEQSFDQLFAYPRLKHERFVYWQASKEVDAPWLEAWVLPLQKAILKAQADSPSLPLFALRLHRAGVQLRFEKNKQEEVSALTYHIQPRAFALQYGGELPPHLAANKLEEEQAVLLAERGYTALLADLYQEVPRAGRLIMTCHQAQQPQLSFVWERKAPEVFAQRRLSREEQTQLVERGYTDYLAGFLSKENQPFAARLFFDAHNGLQLSFQKDAIPTVAPLPLVATGPSFAFPKHFMGVKLTRTLKKQLLNKQQTAVLPKLIDHYQRTEHLHLDARNKVQLGLPLQKQKAYSLHERALAPQFQLAQLLTSLQHPGSSINPAAEQAVAAALEREEALSPLDKQLIHAVHHSDYAAIQAALKRGASPAAFAQEEREKLSPWLQTVLNRSSQRHEQAPPAWVQGLLAFISQGAQPSPETCLQRLKRKRRKSLERHAPDGS